VKTNELKSVDIKGKEYVMVNERLKYFRENYKTHCLTSEIVSMEGGVVTIKASILDDKDRVVATGHAQEKENNGFINKFSYIENCETSAWGRCLANFGIGIDSSVASADEVANAIKNQNRGEKKYKESVHAAEKSFDKDEIENLLLECENIDDVTKLWWLLTKEQQDNKEIHGWFSIRKEQING
jgi:hypothetical protein